VQFSLSSLDSELLNALIASHCPQVTVKSFAVSESRHFGDEMVSTAARARLDLSYESCATELPPRHMVLKAALAEDPVLACLYRNEARFYRRLRKELSSAPVIETPRCYGSAWGERSTEFALLLEDLSLRDARFPNAARAVSLDEVRAMLESLTRLHARYWQSPRFAHDLSWVETHVAGRVCEVMNEIVPLGIQREIDTQPFKREIVQKLRSTGDQLLAGVRAVQRHQANLAQQTFLHGDTHLGNTYLLPDGSAGLIDWQLAVRGYCTHDLSYLIATSLSIEQRRRYEHELLQDYLDRLGELGVQDRPKFDTLWREYRRAIIWGVYIGWLTTPVINYGYEIQSMNLLRLTTAYEDLETADLVAELF
jgi:hypothetical protein